MKAMTIAAILTAMTVTNIARAEIYKWQDELCDMQGNFDNKKYLRCFTFPRHINSI